MCIRQKLVIADATTFTSASAASVGACSRASAQVMLVPVRLASTAEPRNVVTKPEN